MVNWLLLCLSLALFAYLAVAMFAPDRF
ncbi:K(+)-transporting ATPase subunit F [Bowmanella sp. Y26]|nr:K(+)-transporting ATPase subunit F [Bowmanella yangjiangensis]